MLRISGRKKIWSCLDRVSGYLGKKGFIICRVYDGKASIYISQKHGPI